MLMFPYRHFLISVLWFVAIAVHAQGTSQHTVMRGESFASVAKKYGITEDQLKKANPKHQTCYVGLKLTVPVASTPSGNNNSAASPEQYAATTNVQPTTQVQLAATGNDMAQNKEKKKSFWKSLGDALSTVGDIAVSATEGLVETGIVSKESSLGSGLAASADMTNMLRGKDSNYSGYQSDGTIQDDSRSYSKKNTVQPSDNIVGMENRIKAIDIRINQISYELASLVQEDNKNTYGQHNAARKSMANQRKYQNVHNNSVSQRNRALKAGVKAQQPYVNKNSDISRRRANLKKEQSELFAEKKRLRQQINYLTGASQDISNNNDIAASNSESSTKHSFEFWMNEYERWERNAKSCYESLTNTGYKTKKDGQDTGGSAAGSWGTVSFSGMQTNLRKAQKEMRNIRTKAGKEGHNIPQSNYETINVSY